VTRRLDQVSVALILPQEKSRTALAATEDNFARCYLPTWMVMATCPKDL
jgi:hypothetical protein